MQRAPTENIVALCDVDDRRAAPTFKRFPNAPKYRDFRKMLDKEAKNIDAVIVATPDHMHGMAAMWCMERGKHVYVQKPLVRTVWEARQLRDAATKYNVATQMGNQGYSNEGTRQCAEIIWNGEIGNVTEVHAWTDRPLWPQGVTEIPQARARSRTLDWDLWLGVAEKRPFTAGGKTRAGSVGRLLLPAVSTGAASTISAAARWATWRATFSARRTWRSICPTASSSASSASRRKASAPSCSRRHRSSGSISRRTATCRR